MIYNDDNNPREDCIFLRLKHATRKKQRGKGCEPLQMVNFLRDFRVLEKRQHARGEKGVTYELFTRLMERYHGRFQPSEVEYLCNAFDDDRDGYINSERFVRHFTGLNERRHKAVLRAWMAMPKDANGNAQRGHVSGLFDSTLMQKSIDKEQPLAPLQDAEPDDHGDAALTFEEFVAFCAAISADFRVDEKFELFLLREWCADSPLAPIMNETHRDWEPNGNPLGIEGPLHVSSALDNALGVSSKGYNHEHMKRVHPFREPLPSIGLPYLSTTQATYRNYSTHERTFANTLHTR